MPKIIGDTTATPNPHPNWEQQDSSKANYIENKPQLGSLALKNEVGKSDLSNEVYELIEQAGNSVSQDEIYTAINTSLSQAKENGEFDGKDGYSIYTTDTKINEISNETSAIDIDSLNNANDREVQIGDLVFDNITGNLWIITGFMDMFDNKKIYVSFIMCLKGKDGTVGEKGETGEKGDKGEPGEKGEKGDPGEDGATFDHYVTEFGAKGDGVADDTSAFQNALASKRVVFVPGGTYKLSGTLVIHENCCLELSQDTILQFTQTSGNCIEMRGSAVLRGNHAIISVPYELTGNAISVDTLLDGNNHASIPPYERSDPMFKRQRFIYDVNIVKVNTAGYYRTTDGKCSGTALYISATNVPNDSTDIPFIWGMTVSGLRIAGGFSYGIHAINFDSGNGYTDDGWNHDMRIEAVIEACEIGVALENCNGAHLQVTVQPCVSSSGSVKYAKHGVYLNDARFIDMIGSRIWDWNANNSLWTSGGQYQHLALIGNCKGLLLDDFIVHESSADIRSLIYTDTPSNFEKITILQEPANKWFKSVDNKPYFYDGTANRRLMLATEKITAEQTDFIQEADGYYTHEPKFTNLVGAYTDNVYIGSNGANTSNYDSTGYVSTDYIPIDGASAHTYRIGGEGVVFNDTTAYARIAWYDANKNLKAVMGLDKLGSSIYYPTVVEDETVAIAFATNENVVAPKGAAYFRISIKGKGENLIVTLDEKQEYTSIWHGEPKRLDDSIKVKGENVIGADWNAYKSCVEVLDETPTYDGEGLFICSTPFEPIVGSTYNVNYCGTEYTCVAFAVPSEQIVIIGNGEMVGMANTGEPFICIYDSGSLGVVDLTGSESITIRIEEVRYKKMPEELLPKQHYVIRIKQEDMLGDSDNIAHVNIDTVELVHALKSYHPIYIDIGELYGLGDRKLLVADWRTMYGGLTLDQYISQYGENDVKCILAACYHYAHDNQMKGFTVYVNPTD